MWAEAFFLLFCIIPLAMPFLTSPSCLCCGGTGLSCDCCPSNNAPAEVNVTVTGVVNDNCGSCSSVNTTFVLAYDEDTGCRWALNVADTCLEDVILTCNVVSGTVHRLLVGFAPLFGSSCITDGRWRIDINPASVDFCGGDSIVTDTDLGEVGSGCARRCDYSGATVTIQAVV